MQKLILLHLLLLSAAFSATVDLSSRITSVGSTTVIITAQFTESEGGMYLNLSEPIKSVIVRDRSGLKLNSSIETQSNNTLIYITAPVDYLRLEITSDSFTTKEGSLWNFDFSLGMSENISNLSASLSPPKGSILKSTNGAVQGAGDSLLITWKAINITPGEKIRLKAEYELGVVYPSTVTQPATKNESRFPILIAALVLIILILAVAYILKSRKQPVLVQKEIGGFEKLESSNVFKTLDETDKEIVREIFRQKGKTTQSHIYLHTHIPKATLSRRLVSLTNKGMIQKSQKGHRNLVTLTDIFKK